mgnify:CR=1 FL=1|tara:strand:- start:7504 stop:7914 length:411 start_codon:yes stop_codon:yes gene_type:complete
MLNILSVIDQLQERGYSVAVSMFKPLEGDNDFNVSVRVRISEPGERRVMFDRAEVSIPKSSHLDETHEGMVCQYIIDEASKKGTPMKVTPSLSPPPPTVEYVGKASTAIGNGIALDVIAICTVVYTVCFVLEKVLS